MSITVKEVLNKKDLKKFVKLPFSLYKNDPLWVPQLIRDDMEIFNKEKNPAYENADSRLFLAYKDDKLCGRIAAIDNRAANRKYNTRNLRFGWFDAPDDPEVAAALFKTVEGWAKELGMETLTGPHGFCDLDPQGMLVEGFDQLPTIAGYYNFPYYQKLVEGQGFAEGDRLRRIPYPGARRHVGLSREAAAPGRAHQGARRLAPAEVFQ